MMSKAMELKYSWGVDKAGRCSIYKPPCMKILFTGLPKVPGIIVLDAYLELGAEP